MGEDLGRDLVAAGLVTDEHLKAALEYQGDIGGRGATTARILVKLGHLKEEDLLTYVAKREGLEIVEGEEVRVDEEIMAKLPRDLVEEHKLVPLSHGASNMKLALPDASDLPAVEEVRFLTGLEVEVALISLGGALTAIGRYYGEKDGPRPAKRAKRDAHQVAREVVGIPTPAEASRAVASIEASPAKLIKALAALLVDKRIISADDLKGWVHRLE